MKRLHVHVSVANLDQSIRFYSALFGVAPTVTKPDYAKWMLEDPRVNFAISCPVDGQGRPAPTAGREVGLDHLGIQTESREELAALAGQLSQAGSAVVQQRNATCCYARSDKAWVEDPQGISWETFYTFGQTTQYGADRAPEQPADGESACCGGAAPKTERSHSEQPSHSGQPARAAQRHACC